MGWIKVLAACTATIGVGVATAAVVMDRLREKELREAQEERRRAGWPKGKPEKLTAGELAKTIRFHEGYSECPVSAHIRVDQGGRRFEVYSQLIRAEWDNDDLVLDICTEEKT